MRALMARAQAKAHDDPRNAVRNTDQLRARIEAVAELNARPVEGEAPANDAPITPPSRLRSVLVPLVLVLLLGGWIWHERGGPSVPDETDAVVVPSPLAASVDAAPRDLGPTPTPAPEPDPVVEPVPFEPAPPSEPQAPPQPPSAPKSKPRPRPTPTSPDPSSTECESARSAAKRAATSKNWSRVLATTKRSGCWTEPSHPRMLRVLAFYGLGDYQGCLHAAQGLTDSGTRRTASLCRQALDAEGSP